MALTGDWEKIKSFLRLMPKRIEKAAAEIQHEVHVATAEASRTEIKSNQIRPPSKKDGVTLVATSTYVNAISVHKRGGSEYVGLPPSGTHKPSGLPWDEIYKILRFGTGNTPARKHLEPSLIKVARKLVPKLIKKKGFKFPSSGRG